MSETNVLLDHAVRSRVDLGDRSAPVAVDPDPPAAAGGHDRIQPHVDHRVHLPGGRIDSRERVRPAAKRGGALSSPVSQRRRDHRGCGGDCERGGTGEKDGSSSARGPGRSERRVPVRRQRPAPHSSDSAVRAPSPTPARGRRRSRPAAPAACCLASAAAPRGVPRRLRAGRSVGRRARRSGTRRARSRASRRPRCRRWARVRAARARGRRACRSMNPRRPGSVVVETPCEAEVGEIDVL